MDNARKLLSALSSENITSGPAGTYSGLGFGLDMECSQLDGTVGGNNTIFPNLTGDKNAPDLQDQNKVILSTQFKDGTPVTCSTDHFDTSPQTGNAAEISSTLNASDPNGTVPEDTFCTTMLLVAFIRADLGPLSSTTIPTFSSIAFTFTTCRPALHAAPYFVTTDSHILNSTRTGPCSTDLSPYFSPQTPNNLYKQTVSLIADGKTHVPRSQSSGKLTLSSTPGFLTSSKRPPTPPMS